MEEKMSDAYDIGSNYYLSDGRKVELIDTTGSKGFLVSEIISYDDYEGEVTYVSGGLMIADKLYPDPPRSIIDQEIIDLRNQRDTLRREISALKSEISSAESDIKARLAALQKYPNLERLQDWLDGKATHALVQDGSDYACGPVDSVMQVMDDRYRNRMVSLQMTKGHRGLEWKINRYHDGSGHDSRIFLCCSQEEAEAERVRLILLALSDKNLMNNFYDRSRTAKVAQKYGVEIPAEAKALIDADIKIVNDKAIQDARKTIENETAKLAKLGVTP
jgi:hypothetical protein